MTAWDQLNPAYALKAQAATDHNHDGIYEPEGNYEPAGQAWQSYAPVLTGSVSNPTLGTGAQAVGTYVQIGKTVICQVTIVFGTSGAAAGSGNYEVSLPVTAKSPPVASWRVGNGSIYDSSTGAVGAPYLLLASTTTVTMEYPATWPTGSFTRVGAAAPWTWANNDEIRLWFTYEAA